MFSVRKKPQLSTDHANVEWLSYTSLKFGDNHTHRPGSYFPFSYEILEGIPFSIRNCPQLEPPGQVVPAGAFT